MDIVFAPAAAQDIEEIGDYIYAENPPAAIRFIMGLRSRCSRIAGAPSGRRSSLVVTMTASQATMDPTSSRPRRRPSPWSDPTAWARSLPPMAISVGAVSKRSAIWILS
ncbi:MULTISPECIES: type II toxin-antitoxin system RelE/ParE family toxin [Rhizobium]|uniref:type II toxin-antitoxin system RelE/ParE family toxin n=1 Tax=Rhizobium TaxID=379 RepID=UPI0009EBFC68|nr:MULTISPECIES: type II toxin-antitoxin system RelE/ParE family toxin [Rhizobium]MCS0461877.1 type II toxin-antitoxin system RelE/ParE family toxin [Rhizobium favelukesii]UFS79517.1 type II toxin-antitoxin system RelE/ParE family toxin [Rhizobium sp. T136]